VIINQTLAQRLFGSVDPVGRRITVGGAASADVVGVVANGLHNNPRAPMQRTVYYPAAQNTRRLRSLCAVIRTHGNPIAMAPAVRQELRSIDPLLPVMTIDTLDQQLDAVLFQDRLMTNLAIAFGVLAAALAGGGLCATLLYTVARRTREIGVRVALGATHGAVVGMVLTETCRLVLVGTAIGLPLTLFVSRVFSDRLFGVTAHDPATIAGAASIIAATALVAAAAPARRAARIDPMAALASE
jgi:ABC-type antimicrobial peptide transport system permease subunit